MNKASAVMLLVVFGFAGTARACIWDGTTLADEQKKHPTLAEAILNPKTETPDVPALKTKLAELQSAPRKDDPAWWNDVAGTYLRLGQPADAIKILEPITNRFANDYGIHANLGTAYHLLGRYVEAEREIRRDTEINTNAHFGLEKYHLALLQYLSRDQEYRLGHVYVDEFSEAFNKTFAARPSLAIASNSPSYRKQWNLATDPKLDEGVIYMATLNPNEPACWVMLGVLAEYHDDFNLALEAFGKALKLGSPQRAVLTRHLHEIGRQLYSVRKMSPAELDSLNKLNDNLNRNQ